MPNQEGLFLRATRGPGQGQQQLLAMPTRHNCRAKGLLSPVKNKAIKNVLCCQAADSLLHGVESVF